MKKRLYSFLSLIILLTTSYLTLNSCRTTEETVSCFPNTAISVVLNLNLPAYQNLQNVNGWVYIDEQSSGTRGLIVVRTNNGFNIYDRNAPHLCPDSNTTLQVVDNIKIVCPKDNATWILLSGEPTNIAEVSPKIYLYNYDPSTEVLTIYN